MATVFFAYSHTDEDLRDELEVHLTSLKRQGLIESWHDRRIEAGQDWSQAIDENLATAEVILLLVSPDFIASEYCYGVELKRALERHEAGSARVIPVILRPSTWKELPLGKLQATPKDGRPVTQYPDRDEAFVEVTEAVKKAIQAMGGSANVDARTDLSPRGSIPVSSEPRSSNLRIRKEFSQRDRDRFLAETFEFIAKFFENSLSELEARHPPIETNYRRVDANTFDAAIYRDGDLAERCRIWMVEGEGFPRGILYSAGGGERFGSGTSWNEQLSVESDDQKLYLDPSAVANFGGEKQRHLTQHGAAEYLWDILIQHLQ